VKQTMRKRPELLEGRNVDIARQSEAPAGLPPEMLSDAEREQMKAKGTLKVSSKQQQDAMCGLSICIPGHLAQMLKDPEARERLELKIRGEVSNALHVHASRVLLLAIIARRGPEEDNVLCINIVAHPHDLRSNEAIALALGPMMGPRKPVTRARGTVRKLDILRRVSSFRVHALDPSSIECDES